MRSFNHVLLNFLKQLKEKSIHAQYLRIIYSSFWQCIYMSWSWLEYRLRQSQRRGRMWRLLKNSIRLLFSHWGYCRKMVHIVRICTNFCAGRVRTLMLCYGHGNKLYRCKMYLMTCLNTIPQNFIVIIAEYMITFLLKI